MNTLDCSTDHLSSTFNPYAPAAQRLRTDFAPSTGHVPYLTSRPMSVTNPIKTIGWKTNGYVTQTLHTPSRDQAFINAGHIAWVDGAKLDRPVVMSLQQLNWLLLNDFRDEMVRVRNVRGLVAGPLRDILTEDDAVKGAIMDRFQLFGVIANRDNKNVALSSKTARTFTVKVHGTADVYDYWSVNGKPLRPYDHCFFILKLVKIDDRTRFQTNIGANSRTNAAVSVPQNLRGSYQWQIVPYHGPDSVVPLEELVTVVERKKGEKTVTERVIGAYWHVGTSSEFMKQYPGSLFENRDYEGISQRVQLLNQDNQVGPLPFHVKISSNAKIC